MSLPKVRYVISATTADAAATEINGVGGAVEAFSITHALFLKVLELNNNDTDKFNMFFHNQPVTIRLKNLSNYDLKQIDNTNACISTKLVNVLNYNDDLTYLNVEAIVDDNSDMELVKTLIGDGQIKAVLLSSKNISIGQGITVPVTAELQEYTKDTIMSALSSGVDMFIVRGKNHDNTLRALQTLRDEKAVPLTTLSCVLKSLNGLFTGYDKVIVKNIRDKISGAELNTDIVKWVNTRLDYLDAYIQFMNEANEYEKELLDFNIQMEKISATWVLNQPLGDKLAAALTIKWSNISAELVDKNKLTEEEIKESNNKIRNIQTLKAEDARTFIPFFIKYSALKRTTCDQDNYILKQLSLIEKLHNTNITSPVFLKSIVDIATLVNSVVSEAGLSTKENTCTVS